MNQDTVVSLASQAMSLALKVAGPLLLVGARRSACWSASSRPSPRSRSRASSLIPKIVGVAVVIVVLGPWMLGQLVSYTSALYTAIPSMVGS